MDSQSIDPGISVHKTGLAAKVYQSRQQEVDREKLIVDHIEYARQVIYSMLPGLPSNVDVENLVSAGLLGLTKAARNFDFKKGVQFKSFAYKRIRGEVVDELRRNSPLPQKMLKRIGEIRNVIEQLEPPVTAGMISEEMDLSVEEVEDCLASMRIGMPQSWDEVGGFASIAVSHEESNPTNRLEKQEMVEVLASCIQQLDERERNIVIMYHNEQMLLKEIGKTLGISESRTSRLLAKAELHLRQMFESKMHLEEADDGE